MKKSMAERFWSHVAIADSDECWLWTKSCNDDGYGQFRVAMDQSPWRASRVAYRLTFGEILDGLLVCHTCDNPPCCNPKHLFLGTHQDNHDDMVRKGRQGRGGRGRGRTTGNSPEAIADFVEIVRRLSDDQIVEARHRNAGGESCRSIARDFKVAHTTITRLIKGEHWKEHLADV